MERDEIVQSSSRGRSLRFTYHGYLPEGMHDATLEQVRELVVTNELRALLWRKLNAFLTEVSARHTFIYAYFGGAYLSIKSHTEDVDVVLQTRANYGPEAFTAMAPYFAIGLEEIYRRYGVHLHFWCEGFPGGVNDFRLFFQYLRPQDAAPLGLAEGAKKGIVRITL